MKTIKRILFLALVLSIASSCAHKRLAKKASEFEQKAMYAEASDLYYQALLKKNTYIDARLGLKRTGQRVVDDKYSEFTKAYNQGNNKQAVYYYLEATEYEKKLNGVNVNLTVPPYYEEYYNEVKGSYLEDKYFEGKKQLNNDEFSKAETTFREIIRIDPEYRDSKEKLNIAVYEPKYRDGIDNMGKEKYRTAYYLFDEILSKYGPYKDAEDLKDDCRDKATIRIVVEDFTNKSTNQNIDDKLRTRIIQELSQTKNPFLMVVESSSRNTSTMSSVNASSDMIKKLNPDAIVRGTVLSYKYDMGRLKKEDKRGYIEVKTKYKDSEGNTKTKTSYNKVSYAEYSMQRGISINFSFQMINTKNNQIMLTKSFDLSNNDQIHYAKYEGKKSALVPGYWKYKSQDSDEDVIKNSFRDKRQLQSLLSARTKIKTFDALSNELLNNISSRTVEQITSYNPEK